MFPFSLMVCYILVSTDLKAFPWLHIVHRGLRITNQLINNKVDTSALTNDMNETVKMDELQNLRTDIMTDKYLYTYIVTLVIYNVTVALLL